MHKTRATLVAAGLTLFTPLSAFAQEEAPRGLEALFSVDTGLMIWTLLVFGVLLFVLTKYAWKPLLAALEAREEGIRSSIDEASRLRAEGEDLANQHRAQLAEARREAQRVIAESRDAAEKVRREIEDKARAEGQEIVERARREIEQLKVAALEELRREAVELALMAASRLVHKTLDSDTDRALVMQYLDTAGDQGAQA